MDEQKNTSGNWSHISGRDWSYLLSSQPRFADKCDWSKLDGYDWGRLLYWQPQFVDKCDWGKLDGSNWAALLSRHPEFADKCDWSKLDAEDWCKLINIRPQFCEKCDMSKFTGRYIARLLRERNRFSPSGLSRRVDECDFSTLTAHDWCGVLAFRPDLVDRFESSNRDWTADEHNGADISSGLTEDEEAALQEDEP